MKTIQVLVDVEVGDSHEPDRIIMGIMEGVSGKFPHFKTSCTVLNTGEPNMGVITTEHITMPPPPPKSVN